jgi:DNA-binding MarR family transcriptional regulator
MPKPASAPGSRLPLEQRFGYRVGMITRVLSQHMLLYVTREQGLNLAEYRIMTVLAHQKAPSIRDIAANTQFDKAHVTRALTELAARGLVKQAVDRKDRRLRVVELTRAGRAKIAATVPFVIERQRRLEGRFTAHELRALWRALDVLQEEAERMLAEEQGRGARPRRNGGDTAKAAA